MHRIQRGVTLIEILVVVIVLGILAAVVVAAATGSFANPREYQHCDGPNMVYTNGSDLVLAVAANDYRCREGQ